jgi:hypothetical protein
VSLICPAGTATEFAIGAGRDEGSAELDAYLRPDDVAHAVRVVLEQPRFGAHDRVAAVEHPAAELTTMRGAFSAARPRHRSALIDTDQQSLAIPAAGREVAA